MEQAPLRFGPFTFDRRRMTVTRDGKSQGIGRRGAALLGALIDAGGAVVSKERLLAAAWPDSIVEDGNLPVQMAALRKALGERADGKDWIATVPREGYRLVADEDGSSPLTRPSIAVLPFANLSSDPEQDYFADAVVEDLITALSRFKMFAVVARSSSFVYKGRSVDVRDVAHELGVRYVLEGSVRRAGERVRLSAQLIEGATGEHLWAEKFDGPIADIFDVQDTITSSVIGLIEPQIRKAEIERARRKRPENLDAWDLYVQALPLIHSPEVSNYTKALALADRALAIDPDYAPALALAAWAHEKRHTFGGPGLPDFATDIDACLRLAERAVEADPDEALALVQLGWFRIAFRLDFDGIDLVRRAVALNPNNVSVLDFAAVAFMHAGTLDEVIASATRALQLSPGAPNNYAVLSHIVAAHNCNGDYESAAQAGERCVRLAPNYVFGHLHLAVSYAHLGRIEEARREVELARKLRPDMTLATLTNARMKFPERRTMFMEGLRTAGLPAR